MRRLFSLSLALLLALVMALPAAANGVTIQVDGEDLAGVDAILENSRVLVPLRKLSEGLGFTVDYDADTQQITLTGQADSIVLTVGSDAALVNGEEQTMDVPVVVQDGISYVPVRFVSENLGAEVIWDDATQTVSVTTAAATSASVQALFEKAMAASNAGLTVDQKMSGTIRAEVTISMEGMEITMTVPMSMMVHTYNGDMLTKMTMTMPGPLGEESLEMASAVKDGVMYAQDPFSGLWIKFGEVDADGMPDLSSLGMPGLEGLVDLQNDMFKGAQVTDGGRETVGGVETVRLNVVLDPAGVNEMFATLFGSLGLGDDASINVDVQDLAVVFYVDPETGFTHRNEMMMVAVIQVQAESESGSMTMKVEAAFDIDPVSEAIEWPEMEIMEMPELPVDDQDVNVEEEADADADEADADADEADAEGEEADADADEADADVEEADADVEEADAEGEEADAEGEEADAEGEEADAEGEEADAEAEEVPAA